MLTDAVREEIFPVEVTLRLLVRPFKLLSGMDWGRPVAAKVAVLEGGGTGVGVGIGVGVGVGCGVGNGVGTGVGVGVGVGTGVGVGVGPGGEPSPPVIKRE